ncbi:KilA-N domain-containing protein [Flavobacterium geliluteum]|uniref:KilA-N domain-containing protein n=1 Tax=Flavobacterium geliluteum TaxID=2816120 RepID=A0A940XHM3_9FLAO|nr:KilA-N domain-containing protein [Flavobacterium geliluteum]MBP4139970.1 KilA-N domain-containing protein [Flavobacterium geliluteum]
MNATKTTLVEVMEFHGHQIAFEEINGKMMVNATQMAKPFGRAKKPDNWLRTQQAKDLVNVVSVSHICATADLQVIRQGGVNQGTFFQEDVALFFAQWLSPEFYLACNRKLKELLTKQALILPAKNGVTPMICEQQFLYNYNESLLSMGASIKGSTSKRKSKFPEHFFKIYGRNFITAQYFDLLQGYYNYKNATNQLSLAL